MKPQFINFEQKLMFEYKLPITGQNLAHKLPQRLSIGQDIGGLIF